jgi:hypothetical protein
MVIPNRVVKDNGASVGALQIEAIEDVFQPVDDIDQSRKTHACLSQKAM